MPETALRFPENHLADRTNKSDFLKYSMSPTPVSPSIRATAVAVLETAIPYRAETEETDGYAKKRTKYVRWLLYEFTTGLSLPFGNRVSNPRDTMPNLHLFHPRRRDTRPRVERKLNSNCYFNIYHLPRESLGSPSEVWNPSGRHSPSGKMLNARLSASIFQRGFNRCINRKSSSAVHQKEQGRAKEGGEEESTDNPLIMNSFLCNVKFSNMSIFRPV